MKHSKWLGKYRGLFLSFAVFIALLATVLVLNYRWSLEIDQATQKIDAVGEISDEMLFLNNSLNTLFIQTERLISEGRVVNSEVVNSLRTRMRENTKSVEAFIAVLSHGGVYEYDGAELQLLPIVDPEAKAALDDFIEIFKQLQESAKKALADGNYFFEEDLATTVNYANDNIEQIYDYIDVIYDIYFERSLYYSTLAQQSQIIMSAVAVVYFLLFLFYFLRQLGKADKKVALARREVDNILHTIKDGLFLVDANLQIGSQYSANLEHILGRTDIAHQSLEQLLADMISERDMKATKIFVQQLLNPKVVANLIEALNPLSRVQAKTREHEPARWLSFGFLRVMEAGEIIQVLVSVSDVTETVAMEQRLAQEQQKHDEQIDMLTSIVQADDAVMHEFVNKGRFAAQQINKVLRDEAYDEANLHRKLDEIFREVHSLKGEASVVDVRSYVTLCQSFETRIRELQALSSIKGGDFLSLTIFLEELETLNEKVQALYHRLVKAIETPTTKASSSNTTGFVTADAGLDVLAQQVAQREGKQVRVVGTGLEQLVDDEQQRLLKDILVQLVRNAVVHGIESPTIRTQSGKPIQGVIAVSLFKSGENWCLQVQDDGNGIDFAQLEQLAQARGLPPDCDAGYSRKMLLALMISAGISTAKKVGEDAGRGVGSDVILSRVKQLQGKLAIKSQAGVLTCFRIFFPKREG